MSRHKKENMSEETTVNPNLRTLTVSYLDGNLKAQEKPVTYEFVPASEVSEAMTRLNSNPTIILGALNKAIEESAKEAAFAGAGISDQIVRKHALEMANPYRNFAEYAITENGPIKTRAEQTEAIFAFFASLPPIMDMLRKRSKSDPTE